ncbi:MAG TPA: YdeI/OmpD-associated family protein, partial [Limnochordia bacterium]|nr:YdeI/OmpD-associated family protein [Limnochordia bacterium]
VEVALAPEQLVIEEFADDIALALQAEPAALSFFAGMAGFYKREYLKWIEGAKRPETRARRIANMLELLKAGKQER